MASLLLLGGTFDPPPFGHLFLAECARHQFAAGRVLFLPAGDPWRKTGTSPAARDTTPGARGGRTVSDARHRLAMVRRATAGNPAFVVDDREVRRPGPTYTVDTLEELRVEGHGDIVLILGTDAIADMPNWKDPERIPRLARIAIAPKSGEARGPGHEVAGAPATGDGERGTGGREPAMVDMPILPISSTLVRGRVAGGLPIRYLVPAAVARYISDHGLYREAKGRS